MFWKVFDSLEDWFLVITLGAMMILNFANVVSRYLLSTSIAFTEELTTNLFVWSCFIGAGAAAKRGAHLGFDLIVNSMPSQAKRITTARASLCDPNKTIAVIMLSGPSGVGKTETALTLA